MYTINFVENYSHTVKHSGLVSHNSIACYAYILYEVCMKHGKLVAHDSGDRLL